MYGPINFQVLIAYIKANSSGFVFRILHFFTLRFFCKLIGRKQGMRPVLNTR